MPEVRPERTGWRDAALSEEHRKFGWNCPAVDLDFLLLEYDRGTPSALIEYKNEHAKPQYASNPSYQALSELGKRADIPTFVCRYKDDFSIWTVIPLNDVAKEHLPKRKEMNEPDYVRFLYRLRGRECPQSVIDKLGVEI